MKVLAHWDSDNYRHGIAAINRSWVLMKLSLMPTWTCSGPTCDVLMYLDHRGPLARLRWLKKLMKPLAWWRSPWRLGIPDEDHDALTKVMEPTTWMAWWHFDEIFDALVGSSACTWSPCVIHWKGHGTLACIMMVMTLYGLWHVVDALGLKWKPLYW